MADWTVGAGRPGLEQQGEVDPRMFVSSALGIFSKWAVFVFFTTEMF